MNRFCINRHDQTINAVFLDYAVHRVGLKRLWKLRWSRALDIHALEPAWSDWMKNFRE